jgi:hypothetical protein
MNTPIAHITVAALPCSAIARVGAAGVLAGFPVMRHPHFPKSTLSAMPRATFAAIES